MPRNFMSLRSCLTSLISQKLVNSDLRKALRIFSQKIFCVYRKVEKDIHFSNLTLLNYCSMGSQIQKI